MLAIDRQNAIMEILAEKKSATVSDLGQYLRVTPETIRRDLASLEKQSKLVRVHGGATLIDSQNEIPVWIRRDICINERMAIAATCMDFIEENETIALDRSTTACCIAKNLKLRNMNLTVVTNSLDVLSELSDCDNIRLICIGGNYRKSTASFSGSTTIQTLENIHMDSAFVSCSRLDLGIGMMDYYEDESCIRALMLRNSNKKYLVATSNKFGKKAPYLIGNITNVDMLVTDYGLDEQWMEYFAQNGVRVTTAIKP